MHVLMVAERLPPAVGGVERHVEGLTRNLVEGGYTVTLVAPSHTPGLDAEGEIAGARVLRIPCKGRTRKDYVGAWRWWVKQRSILDQADVIHFHEVYSLLHWFGPTRFLCPSRPFFLTYHGYEMRYPVPLRARFYRRLATGLVRGYIAVGDYLSRWFRLRPQEITYGAVTLPQRVTPPTTPPSTVFVGRLDTDTSIEIYIRGLGLLQRQYNLALPFTVCGDGPLRQDMEKLAEKEAVETTFIGLTLDPSPYLFQASVIFASGYLAMLEGMAHLRPVLSAYHTPVKADYLRSMPGAGDNFCIVDSLQDLCDQLHKLLTGQWDPSPQIEAAFQFAADQSWSKLAQMYTRLWGST